MSAWMRLRAVASGVVMISAGVLVGAAVSATGCGMFRPCPDVEPLRPGSFEIVDGRERPELVGGLLVADDEGVEISYSLAEGGDWVVRYAIESRVPE
jgi:hypothetical protein